MKILKFLAVAFVAIMGLNSCSEDYDHDFIKVDYTKEIVGTWTCLEAGLAQAFVFNADGTAVTSGVKDGEYWEDIVANWKLVNNKLTLSYEANVSEFLVEMIPGKILSIVELESGVRNTFEYCANELSEEVVGMWVCNEGSTDVQTGMAIQTFSENGKVSLTTGASVSTNLPLINKEAEYKVFGDLLVRIIPEEGVSLGVSPYLVTRMVYAPNATSLGDMMYMAEYVSVDGKLINVTSPWLRIKQTLDLEGKGYDYSNIYVTNVKGVDKEFDFAGQTLNFSTLNGNIMDKLMKSIFFNVSFPTSDKICYSCYYNGNNASIDAPIVVEGNKLTIKMSENNPVYRDIVLYAFQDVDDRQLHMYMPTSSFEKFIANISVVVAAKNGEMDLNDAAAVADLYNKIENAIESINVSFIFKSIVTRAL